MTIPKSIRWLIPAALLLPIWLFLQVNPAKQSKPKANPGKTTPSPAPHVTFQMPWAGYRMEALYLYEVMQDGRTWHTPRQRDAFILTMAGWLQNQLPQQYPGFKMPPEVSTEWLHNNNYQTIDDFRKEYLLYKHNYFLIEDLTRNLLQKHGSQLIPVIQDIQNKINSWKHQNTAHGTSIIHHVYNPGFLEKILEKEGCNPPYQPQIKALLEGTRKDIQQYWGVEFQQEELPELFQWLEETATDAVLRQHMNQQEEISLMQQQWLRQSMLGWRVMELHEITLHLVENLRSKIPSKR